MAVAARKSSSWRAPVVCEGPEAMCEPSNSGGSSWLVQLSICWRSCGSMQSETQTRSVRSQDLQVHPGAAGGARLDLQLGVGCRSSSSSR